MLHTQELKMCKKIGYEYYCKELFVVKSKTRYSYTSAIYFNLESDVIKANCEFQYYYNKMDIKTHHTQWWIPNHLCKLAQL